MTSDVAICVELTIESALPAESHAVVRIREGKYHQVKRMFEAVGHPVLKLARMRFGDVTCEGLPLGAFRRLKPHEVKRLWNLSRFGRQE